MATSDLGHQLTDKELAKLERRIAKLYREAEKELQATIDAYFEQFKKRDEEMKALIGTVQNGKEWTEADYKQWRLNQIGRGERYQAMRDRVAHRVTDANAVAVSYTNDATPGIYSLNRNYSAYTIEQVAGNVGFDLWDEQTVKRLIVEQPGLMPYYPKERALKRGIDLAYGKKQITASVTSSILQGLSIMHMADNLQKRITTMSRDSAIRTARTAVTGAQNAGRMDSYAAAEKMGIKLKKQWLATLDGRTRHAHAMLDGQTVDIDKPFKVDGNEIMFPGDTSAPGYLVYNCRCTVIADVGGVNTSIAQRRARNASTGETEVVSDMTYAEWAGWKTGKAKSTGFDYIQKFTPATNIDEAVKYAKEALGLGQTTAYQLGMNLDVANELNKAIARINDTFGSLTEAGYLDNVLLYTKKTDSYAAYSNSLRTVFLNPVVKQKGAIKKMTADAIGEFEPGAWSTGNAFHTVYHELGHAVQHMILDNDATKKNQIDVLYRKAYSDILGDNTAWTMDIAKALSLAKKAKAAGFSYYGLRNSKEFVAESIAQYFLAENPSEIAKEVASILKGK